MEKILDKVYISDGIIAKEYVCIWDTGSMQTLVSDKIISHFNPTKHGYVSVNSIHGEQRSDKYILNLTLNNYNKAIRINPASIVMNREFDVIIGMDIITHGLFILNKGEFSFTIEL